jgi:hypothetical protein
VASIYNKPGIQKLNIKYRNMKKSQILILFLFFFCGIGIVNAQTGTDSIQSQKRVDYNVQPESVQMADTTVNNNFSSTTSNYGKETETIHIYSGSHTGNNIIRTIEVPLPDANSRNGYYNPNK